jgi:large subunit ribosomal protein L30
MSKLAVILVRGILGTNPDIRSTLTSLNLLKKHTCTIVDDTPSMRGMLKKVQDFTTFGTVSDEVLKELRDVRGRKDSEGNILNTFFLAPPKGGFERKGIKKSFSVGGALGDRKDKINDLIKKML